MIFKNKKTKTNYIDTSSVPTTPDENLTVLSLFTGTGGLDLGLEQAGFQTLLCLDNDPDCLATLRHNRPDWQLFLEHQYEEDGEIKARPAGDIRFVEPEELLEKVDKKAGEITLLTGGAPCQPFSNIGTRQGKKNEKYGDLFQEFVRMVKGVQPQAFIFENVTGITQNKHKSVIKYMIKQFKGMDYGISDTILNAAHYGVGQKRVRFFLIGIKNQKNPAFPLPTYFRNQFAWKLFKGDLDQEPSATIKPLVTVGDVFAKLPANYKKRIDYVAMQSRPPMIERIKLVQQGENFRVLPMDMRPKCWQGDRHKGSDTFGRLREDKPAVTIRTGAYNPTKGRYIHPTEHRGLNSVEMAALQGFPAEWEFRVRGNKKATLSGVCRQIGNAVPPPLAKELGLAIRGQL